jgi:hypothetical protein
LLVPAGTALGWIEYSVALSDVGLKIDIYFWIMPNMNELKLMVTQTLVSIDVWQESFKKPIY